MIWSKGDYAEHEDIPEVVWKVKRLRFNGGDPLLDVIYLGSANEQERVRNFRRFGLSPRTRSSTFYARKCKQANGMLVLALESGEEGENANHCRRRRVERRSDPETLVAKRPVREGHEPKREDRK